MPSFLLEEFSIQSGKISPLPQPKYFCYEVRQHFTLSNLNYNNETFHLLGLSYKIPVEEKQLPQDFSLNNAFLIKLVPQSLKLQPGKGVERKGNNRGIRIGPKWE